MASFSFALPSINHEMAPALMMEDQNDDEDDDNCKEDEEIAILMNQIITQKKKKSDKKKREKNVAALSKNAISKYKRQIASEFSTVKSQRTDEHKRVSTGVLLCKEQHDLDVKAFNLFNNSMQAKYDEMMMELEKATESLRRKEKLVMTACDEMDNPGDRENITQWVEEYETAMANKCAKAEAAKVAQQNSAMIQMMMATMMN